MVSRVADHRLGLALVFVVVCMLALVMAMAICITVSTEGVGVVWVLKSALVEMASVVWMSMFIVVMALVWVLVSSSKMAPWDSPLAWATTERQSPAPCPSVSHFHCSLSFPCCIPSSYPPSCPSFHTLSSFSWFSFPFASYPSL